MDESIPVSILRGSAEVINSCRSLSVTPSFYDAACTNTLVEPVRDIQSCVRMKTAVGSPFSLFLVLMLDLQLPRCKKMLKDSCYDIFDMISCTAARDFCMQHLDLPPGA